MRREPRAFVEDIVVSCALKGDSRYEIRWDPSHYSVDKGEMGPELMKVLISNVYKP